MAASPPAPPKLGAPPATEAPKESVIARFLIAPLQFLSFLLSLALVSAIERHRRAEMHAAPTEILGGVTRYWSKSGEADAGYFRRMQRKMMRMEVGEAFDLQAQVLRGLVIGLGVLGLVIALSLCWLWGIVS